MTETRKLDDGTAIIIARSLACEPGRWKSNLIWLERDDGFQLAIVKPFDKTIITPRWVSKDAYGEERVAIPSVLAGLRLKRAVKKWWKHHGPALDAATAKHSGLPEAA